MILARFKSKDITLFLMKILRNLRNYEGPLTEVNVRGENYRTIPDFEPSVIFAQAFGADTGVFSYNQRLAIATRDAREFFEQDLTAIVQEEVGKCLKRIREGNFYSIGESYKEGERAKLRSKIDTRGVLELCGEVAEKSGLDVNKVLYIAHPLHIYRVMEIGKKLGFDGEPFIEKEVHWNPEDKQPWVRSVKLWIPREILTRIHHKIMGVA